MKETVLTGKRRSTTIAATPDDGNSQMKKRRRRWRVDPAQMVPLRVGSRQVITID